MIWAFGKIVTGNYHGISQTSVKYSYSDLAQTHASLTRRRLAVIHITI